ncbi:HET domain protein [Xylaria arbuscula]|nr:HET domain protein [Xylaria arbuscula]
MRLINVQTLALEEVMLVTPGDFDYAILSHTWGDDEVTYQDMANSDRYTCSKPGFLKIAKTCEFARRDGIKYAWVDTCCIDKTSSAELTEAINSMFNWYRDAKVCYAWLEDLPPQSEEPIWSSLRKCRWLTRGWTLQELLAPRRVEFYDSQWDFRGTKADLKTLIADASRIESDVLENPNTIFRLPIAQRMSWAARRETTRLEDMAYCLIGIFEVNMPMLYGEGGERAFLRLQEQIVKETNDLSIFAWKAIPAESQKYRGIFARSPAEFRDCHALRLIDDPVFSPEFTLSNKGLRITTDLVSAMEDGAYLLKLNCKNGALGHPLSIWIHHHGGEVYSRIRAHELGSVLLDDRPSQKRSITIFKQLDGLRSVDLEASHRHAFVLRNNFNTAPSAMFPVFPFPEFPFDASPIEPYWSWDSSRHMLHTRGVGEFVGFAYFSPRFNSGDAQNGSSATASEEFQMAGEWFLVAFGRRNDEPPWITVHGKENKYGTQMLEAGSTDLQRMGRMARESLGSPGSTSVTLRNFAGDPFKVVSASLVEGTMDGQDVCFIDLDIQDVLAPRYVKDEDLLTWRSPHIDYTNSTSHKDEDDLGEELEGAGLTTLFG